MLVSYLSHACTSADGNNISRLSFVGMIFLLDRFITIAADSNSNIAQDARGNKNARRLQSTKILFH